MNQSTLEVSQRICFFISGQIDKFVDEISMTSPHAAAAFHARRMRKICNFQPTQAIARKQ